MKHSLDCPDCSGAVQHLPRNAGRALIWIYRHTLSALVGYNCRHLPTCSVYADEAIERFGLWGGGWMTVARLLRCQPDGICHGDSAGGAASMRLEEPVAPLSSFKRNAHCAGNSGATAVLI
jgi:putative membrane protein insertion efficiency factor